MDFKFWRRKGLLAAVILTVILVASALFLVTLKTDYDRANGDILLYFSNQPDMTEAFAALARLTPTDAVVFCWWDYGRAVTEWSARQVIEAYPSREIAESVANTRSFLGNLEAQLFARWGSNERIQALASAFMSNEEQSLQILKTYNATYALVFTPDELDKFYWIAKFAGYDSTDYLTRNETTQAYQPTSRGSEVTLMHLIYDDIWQPQHFTKVFDNTRAKIYQINY